MKIYLAGPLFTTAEREFNASLARALRACGHELFVPQESEQGRMTATEIFLSNVRGIDWADVVVANMDGPDPDSGTSWELWLRLSQEARRLVPHRFSRRSRARWRAL
jgi:nucleoside 2-deoxyribosyltransferase